MGGEGRPRRGSDPDHRSQRLPPLHGVKPLFRLLQRNDPRHHPIQVELALPVPLRQQREIARRQAIAIPGDAEVAAEIETMEEKFAAKLSDAARALEGVAGVLDDTAPLPQG